MPITIFDSDTIPRDRRAELEAAVIAAGRHLTKLFDRPAIRRRDRRRADGDAWRGGGRIHDRNPSNALRDRAAHRPYPCGKGEGQVFCGRRHSTLHFAAQGTYLIAPETSDVYAGRALSEEKCIPVVGKGFKPHCDRLRLLVDVFQAALPP